MIGALTLFPILRQRSGGLQRALGLFELRGRVTIAAYIARRLQRRLRNDHAIERSDAAADARRRLIQRHDGRGATEVSDVRPQIADLRVRGHEHGLRFRSARRMTRFDRAERGVLAHAAIRVVPLPARLTHLNGIDLAIARA